MKRKSEAQEPQPTKLPRLNKDVVGEILKWHKIGIEEDTRQHLKKFRPCLDELITNTYYLRHWEDQDCSLTCCTIYKSPYIQTRSPSAIDDFFPSNTWIRIFLPQNIEHMPFNRNVFSRHTGIHPPDSRCRCHIDCQ
jgi:hypothetical protein